MQSTRYSCRNLMKLEFSRKISEKYVSNFMNIRPVGVEVFRAEGWTDRQANGRTDMTKQMVVFVILRSRLKIINDWGKKNSYT